MKTPEDEAFDELARKQGAWGGGFKAKQAMAADKLQEPERKALQMCLEYIETNAHERKHVRHAIQAALAQPAQEPISCARCKDLEEQAYDLLGQLKVANLKWSVAHPQPAQERNFCERCGKRTADKTLIHTCTPPQGAA